MINKIVITTTQPTGHYPTDVMLEVIMKLNETIDWINSHKDITPAEVEKYINNPLKNVATSCGICGLLREFHNQPHNFV